MKYDIKIDDYIGWGASSAAEIIPKVEALEGQPCNVYISSFGGYCHEGLQIYQAFKSHGNVTVHIFGMTASAATILAMGAKTVKMSKNAIMLIHRAALYQDIWGSLNSEGIENVIAQLKNDQNTLDKLDDIVAAIYAEHAQGDAKEFAEEMKKEEWISAKEAKEFGLVDEILEEGDATAMTDDLARRIVACGYPMPKLERATRQPSVMERLKSVLTDMGFLPEKKKENATSHELPTDSTTAAAAAALQNNIQMNKTFSAIMAILGVEAIAQAENGSVTLSAEQMEQLNKAVADAQKEVEDAKKTNGEMSAKIKDLSTQVENLLKDDGAENEDAVPATAEESGSFNATMSNLLRDL